MFSSIMLVGLLYAIPKDTFHSYCREAAQCRPHRQTHCRHSFAIGTNDRKQAPSKRSGILAVALIKRSIAVCCAYSVLAMGREALAIASFYFHVCKVSVFIYSTECGYLKKTQVFIAYYSDIAPSLLYSTAKHPVKGET